MIHTRSRSDGLEWRSSSTKARGITQVRGEAGAADAKTQDLHVGLKQQPGRCRNREAETRSHNS